MPVNALYPARPLIVFDEETQTYCLDPDTASYLTAHLDEDAPLRILAIAGLYRTGKSGLMRCMFGCDFKSTATTNSCTKGIWVSHVEEHDLLVVDTEGLGSSDTPADAHDSTIFALALILCGSFCYNSRGNINDRALSSIATTLEIAKVVHATGALAFPTFTWILRDFTLRLATRNGERLSPTEYLEQVLQITPQHDEGKRRVRETIKTLFARRACATLVRPCDRDSDLQDLTSLRPEFERGVADLRTRLLGGLRPLTRDGTPVTPPVFVALASRYVDTVNRGAVPRIGDVWTLVCRDRNRAVCLSAVALFEERAREIEGEAADNGPRELARRLDEAAESAVAQLRGRLIGGANPRRAAEAGAARDMRRVRDAMLAKAEVVEEARVRAVFDKVEQQALLAPKPSALKRLYDDAVDGLDARHLGLAVASIWRVVPRYYNRCMRTIHDRLKRAEKAAEEATEREATHLDRIRALEQERDRVAAECDELRALGAEYKALERRHREAQEELAETRAETQALRRDLAETVECLRVDDDAADDDGASTGDDDEHLAAAKTIADLEEEMRVLRDDRDRCAAAREAADQAAASLRERLSAAQADAARLERVDQDNQALREDARRQEEKRVSAEARIMGEARKVEEDAMESVRQLNAMLAQQRKSGDAQRARFKQRLEAANAREGALEKRLAQAQEEHDQCKGQLTECNRRVENLQAEMRRAQETAAETQTHSHKTLRAYAQKIADNERERSRREIDALRKEQKTVEVHRAAVKRFELEAVRLRAKTDSEAARRAALEKDLAELRARRDGSVEAANLAEVVRAQRDEARNRLEDAVNSRDDARRERDAALEDVKALRRTHAAELKRRDMAHITECSALRHQLSELQNLDF